LEKSMRNLRQFWREFKEFIAEWQKFLFWRLYRAFSWFERVKDFIAQLLYRQRGRFARPFVHTAMGGLVTMAVTLAPVLASSFPGVEKELPAEILPTTQVLEVESTDTGTQVSDKVRDQAVEYTVQAGDTVSEIADKFGISTDTIRWENNLASLNAIKPGQTLRILPVSGVRHKVSRGETIYSIAKKYDANPQAVVDFPFNNFADDETFALAVGQDLIVPDGKKPNEVLWSPSKYIAQNTPNAGAVSAIGTFVWPIGGRITQRFAWYHRGVDIAAAFGTPILAADAGRVTVAGWPDNSGYGIRVVIDHGNGYQTWYGHMSRVAVALGQSVNRGNVIGYEGSTGRSTGPHCHFEIRKGGVPVNPLEYLK
jgi:murein DD-endopeptidase MepM/ murein hydrolase activator NlpD